MDSDPAFAQNFSNFLQKDQSRDATTRLEVFVVTSYRDHASTFRQLLFQLGIIGVLRPLWLNIIALLNKFAAV